MRGSLRGRVFRGFQKVFRGFQRFLEVFRGFSKALSETLSECHFPLRVAGRVAPSCCPLKLLQQKVLTRPVRGASVFRGAQKRSPDEANASPETHSEARGRSSGAGHQQPSKPEKQDSQHVLNQPCKPFGTFSTFSQRVLNTAIAEKRKENLEILTKLVRKRLTRKSRVASQAAIEWKTGRNAKMGKWPTVRVCGRSCHTNVVSPRFQRLPKGT